MKYLKLFEDYDENFDEDDYNEIALDYANKYYHDEVKGGPYGDYYEILDRLNDFCNTDFPYGIQDIPNTVILYRLLNVDSIDDINKEDLGKSFVGDKDMYDDYDFVESFLHRYGEETKKWFIVTIEMSSENIDMSSTLGNRAEYPDEYEIAIIDDRGLKIVDIGEVEPH
jgi:hypothetical protein